MRRVLHLLPYVDEGVDDAVGAVPVDHLIDVDVPRLLVHARHVDLRRLDFDGGWPLRVVRTAYDLARVHALAQICVLRPDDHRIPLAELVLVILHTQALVVNPVGDEVDVGGLLGPTHRQTESIHNDTSKHKNRKQKRHNHTQHSTPELRGTLPLSQHSSLCE